MTGDYAFETEQELIDETGFSYPGESDAYIRQSTLTK